MENLGKSIDEFFLTRVAVRTIKAQLGTIQGVGLQYFDTRNPTIDEIVRAWDTFRSTMDRITETPFISLIQEYLTEHVSAASAIFKTILRKNSVDSEKWTQAVQQQKTLFRQINDLIITLHENCMDQRRGRINMEYISKCCDQFHILRKAITTDFDIIFQNAVVSNYEAADARSRCCGHIQNCICALSPPSEIAERVDMYNFWKRGNHVTRFRSVLENVEDAFKRLFPGFVPRVIIKEVTAQAGEEQPSSGRRNRVVAPIDRSDEVARLLKENAMLKERIRELEEEVERLKKQLELAQALASDDDISKDAQYLLQKNQDMAERNSALEADVLRLQGVVQALYARLRGNENQDDANLAHELLQVREERDNYALAVQQLKDTLNMERSQHKHVLRLPSGDGQLIKDNMQLRATTEKLLDENGELQQMDRKRKKYKQGMTASNEQLTDLQRELNEAREKAELYDELEAENRNIQQELNKLKRKNATQEQEIQRLKLDAGASDELQKLRQENNGIKRENKKLKDDVDDKDSSIKQLQVELSKLKGANDTANERNKQLELDLTDSHESEERLKKQIENLKRLLDEAHNSGDLDQLTQTIEKLRKQKQELQEREADLSAKITEQELMIKKLQGSDNSDILNQEIAQLKQAKKDLKEKAAELEKRNRELETLIKQLQDDERVNQLMQDLEKLKQQKREANDKVEELTRTVTRQELEINRLKKNMDAEELSDEIERLKKENAKLKEKLAASESQIQDLSTENEDMQLKLKELKKLQAENKDQKVRIETLEYENQEAVTENGQIKSENQKLKLEIDEMRTRLRDLDDLEENDKTQSQRIDELIAENKRLKKEQGKLDELDRAKEKIGRMKTKIETLGSSVQSLEQENDTLKDSLDQLRSSDKERSKRIAELESSLKGMADSSELDAMQKENAALRAQIEKLKEELAVAKNYSKQAYEENQAISSENDDLNLRIEQMEKEKEIFDDVRAVIEEMKEIKKKYGELKKACSNAPEDQQLVAVNGKEMERTEAERQIEQLKKKFTKKDKKWSQARANATMHELEVTGTRLENLENNYRETVAALRDLRKEYTDLLNEKLRLDARVRSGKYGPEKVVDDSVKKMQKMQKFQRALQGQLEDVERVTFGMEEQLGIKPDEDNEDLTMRLQRVSDTMGERILIQMYSNEIEE